MPLIWSSRPPPCSQPAPRTHFKLPQQLRESPSISPEHQVSKKHRMQDGLVFRLRSPAKGDRQVKFFLCLIKADLRTLLEQSVIDCFPLWEPYKLIINELVNPMTVTEVKFTLCNSMEQDFQRQSSSSSTASKISVQFSHPLSTSETQQSPLCSPCNELSELHFKVHIQGTC